jgi:hypothetical protein
MVRLYGDFVYYETHMVRLYQLPAYAITSDIITSDI